MEKKQKRNLLAELLAVAIPFFALALAAWCKTDRSLSVSERRQLAQRPAWTFSAFLSGDFAEEYAEYATDQFPFRDSFRGIKAMAVLGLFAQKDNDGLYVADGQISKLEYPQRGAMLAHAADCFSQVVQNDLQGTDSRLYFALIPDKNRYLAKENGMLSMDYASFTADLRSLLSESLPAPMEWIDLSELLSAEDYYPTDIHWRQEAIVDVAEAVCQKLGVSSFSKEELRTVTLPAPFSGVYLGQSALLFPPDSLSYLTNDTLQSCLVSVWDSGEAVPCPLYDTEAALNAHDDTEAGLDAYDLFLSGPAALQTIENPLAGTDRELLLFRDSFGSSLAPLLVRDYAKITLIDLRYIPSTLLRDYIDFHGQDVLFLYSTTLLNNSLAIR